MSRNTTNQVAQASSSSKPAAASLDNVKSPSMTNLHKHVSSHTSLFHLLKEIN